MPLMCRVVVLTVFACGVDATSARGQVPAPGRVVLEAPLGPLYTFEVATKGEDGVVKLVLRKRTTDPPPGLFDYTEGYYVMILESENRPEPDLIRAQVTEIGNEGMVTLTIGIRALNLVRLGRFAHLVRPFRSTTDLMRTLPDVIPYETDPAGAAQVARNRQLMASVNNLKQIGLALHNFHLTNNAFPPAVLYGPDGKPWHSWRVLILPYLQEVKVYNQYDFGQPWDSEKNLKLLDAMPAVYHDPIYGEEKGRFTNYAAFIGAWKTTQRRGLHTLLQPSGEKFSLADGRMNSLTVGAPSVASVVDGTSNTIAVVPVSPERAIPWTKPEDIPIDEKFAGLGRPGGTAAPYAIDDKTHAAPVLYADGSVRVILDTVRPDALQWLATRDGAEVVSHDLAPSLKIPSSGAASDQKVLKIDLTGRRPRAWIE